MVRAERQPITGVLRIEPQGRPAAELAIVRGPLKTPEVKCFAVVGLFVLISDFFAKQKNYRAFGAMSLNPQAFVLR